MNLKLYLEKLQTSEEYKKFAEENPKAYLCSGFFIIDKENPEANQQDVDFYIPESKDIVSFCVSDSCQKKPVDFVDKENLPDKIDFSCNFDFEEVENIINEKMKQEGVKNKLQKILLSLQSKNGKCFLVGTIFVSSLGLIKIRIDLENMNVIDFEKKSLMDMLRVVKGK